jgi:hypothetical protein
MPITQGTCEYVGKSNYWVGNHFADRRVVTCSHKSLWILIWPRTEPMQVCSTHLGQAISQFLERIRPHGGNLDIMVRRF